MIDLELATKQVKEGAGLYWPCSPHGEKETMNDIIDFIFDCKFFFASGVSFVFKEHKKKNSFQDRNNPPASYYLAKINFLYPSVNAKIEIENSLPENVLFAKIGGRYIGMFEILKP